MTVLASLKAAIGTEKIISEGSQIIVQPTVAFELQQIFVWACTHDIPVYVYAQPKAGGVIVDLSEMNVIHEVDTANLVAAVEPGVKLSELSSTLAKMGLRFIPGDTPLYRDKTVGELFHEGCSNIASLKYGFTKHFLMGMEVVLPTGELLKTGAKTVKNVTGYDLTRFLSGSYNNLSVTVKFLLKLLPVPESKKSVSIMFNSTNEIFSFVDDFRAARITPVSLIWLDAKTQQQLNHGSGMEKQLAVIEFDGVTEEVEKQWNELDVIVEKNNGAVTKQAALDNLFTQGFVLNDQFKFPYTVARRFIDGFYPIAAGSGVEAGLFGQIAEGKINVRFKTLGSSEKECIDKLIPWVVEIGGYSSGKFERVFGGAREGALLQLERQVKAVLDPQLLLNR